MAPDETHHHPNVIYGYWERPRRATRPQRVLTALRSLRPDELFRLQLFGRRVADAAFKRAPRR